MNKSEKDLIASIKVLNHNLNGYHSGLIECYLPVAVELRKLLCDKKPLLPRVRPDIKFHKLNQADLLDSIPSLKGHAAMLMPGRLTIDNGVSFFQLIFAKGWIEMDLTDWLEQPFFNEKITIREVIKSVGDKEAAHSDENYNETLKFSMNIKYYDKDSHVAGIIGLGDYVAEILKRNGIE